MRNGVAPPRSATRDGQTVVNGFSPARSKVGKVGSLGVFWPLVEPILTRLRPRRFCEIGVESGAFTERLLDWGRANGCGYAGVDPVIDPALAARLDTRDLHAGHSLDILPRLARCGVYFVDGDHNYHTVLHELELIQQSATRPGQDGDPAGPVVFVHDVGWPWGRRDMYYQPSIVPEESRRPSSGHLGVGLDGDELVDGGLRDPANYHIALEAGGPRNGVLTAVEDFLAGDAGRAWESIIVPAAYGLAILYRPDDGGLPAECRDHLRVLRAAVDQTRDFLSAYDVSYLTAYLYGEHVKYELDQQTRRLRNESGAHHRTLEAYRTLDEVYRTAVSYGNGVTEVCRGVQEQYSVLQSSYTALQGAYSALQTGYSAFQREYAALLAEYNRLLDHNAGLQKICDDFISISRDLVSAASGNAAETAVPASGGRS